MEEKLDGWTDGQIQKLTAGQNLDPLFRTVGFYAINTKLPKLYLHWGSIGLLLVQESNSQSTELHWHVLPWHIQATFFFIHHFYFWI